MINQSQRNYLQLLMNQHQVHLPLKKTEFL